jgi:fatty acid CoA ligase FadD32
MAVRSRTDYHNPFIQDGKIRFPDNANLVRTVDRWASVRGDKLAYRFLDYSTERDGVARDISWAEFGVRNRAVGARLRQVTQPGDRVAILCGQNLDYLVSFFGILYSGRIAVPLFDPGEPGHVGRLHAVLDDCTPSAILTSSDAAEGVRKFFRSRPATQRPRIIAVDAVPAEVGFTWELIPAADTIAYLQYTSGSTRTPTGVQITHLNLPTNMVQVLHALQGGEGDRGVTWLPFFHDMGLITVLLMSVVGGRFTFMSPAAFVRRPYRWIRELARTDDDTGESYSAAPNFAFEHAALRGLPRDGDPPLDLSNVKAILNGSEPVSPASLRKFAEAFAPYGLREQAIKPCYGLAEATLFVSMTPIGAKPKIIHVDREALNNQNRFVEVAPDSPHAVRQVSAGKVSIDQWVTIVDVETASELPDGQIGEMWLHGNNIGTGYWNRLDETSETFKNILKSRTSPSHAEGAPDDGLWVRTGDYGANYDGDLYITGRIKDLVIVDGRNHYPQDLEYSAQEASRALRAGYVAAFSVPANQLPQQVFDNPHAGLKYDPEDTSEQLVIVGERASGAYKLDYPPIAAGIRAAIAVRHGVTVRDVLLVPAGSIPRTSSGKIGRRACRAAYLDGSLRSGVASPTAFPDRAE